MKKLYLVVALIGGIAIGVGIMTGLENATSNEPPAPQLNQAESQKEELARLADQLNASLSANLDLSKRVEELEALAASQSQELLRLIDLDNTYTAENYDLLTQVERLKALAETQKNEASARTRALETKIKELELLVELQKESLLRFSGGSSR